MKELTLIESQQKRIAELEQLVSDYKEASDSKKALVRRLDVLINGEAGAAKQASLCDIVSQVEQMEAAEPVDTSTWRMDAYYYGFVPTGVPAIDRMLAAVATAGSAFHNTEDWNQECSVPAHLRGKTPIDFIQNAAYDAANVYTKPQAAPVRELSDDEDELWKVLEAATEALDRKAAPHAWVSIAWDAGYKHITDRRAILAAARGQDAAQQPAGSV